MQTKGKFCTSSERRTPIVTPITPHEFLENFNVKSYKSITTAKGERMILGYFEKLTDIELALDMSFTLLNQEFRWSRSTPPFNRKKKSASGRSSKSPKSKDDRAQSKSKENNTKRSKTKKTASNKSKDYVLAEVMKLL
jgi:hypothetical protein